VGYNEAKGDLMIYWYQNRSKRRLLKTFKAGMMWCPGWISRRVCRRDGVSAPLP